MRHARRGAKDSAAGTTADEAQEKEETTALTAIGQAAEHMVANQCCTMFGAVETERVERGERVGARGRNGAILPV